MAVCTNDVSLGPASSCRSMDFTLSFEFIFLTIVPSTIYILLSLPPLLSLLLKPRLTKSTLDTLVLTKLTLCLLLLVSLSLTLSFLPSPPQPSGNTRTWSLALELTATSLYTPTTYLHHTRTLSPSTFHTLYMLLTAFFCGTQVRSYANSELQETNPKFFASSVVALSARILLVVFESLPKRSLLRPDVVPIAKEPTSPLLSRLFFTYLFPVLLGGFRRAYTLDDIAAFGLPPTLTAQHANTALSRSLAKFRPRSNGKTKMQPLLRPSLLAFPLTFLSPAPPKLLLIAATFAQPFLVKSMLSFVESHSAYSSSGADEDEKGQGQDAKIGWALVGAYAGVYLCIAFCTGVYWDKVYIMVVQYRAALVSAIFDKSLLLSASIAESEGKGTAVTYMSVDVERVCEGIAFFHETWTALVSVGAAAAVLWFQASYATLPPLLLIAAFFLLTSRAGKKVAGAQRAWMGSTQERVKLLTSLTSHIIPIKLLSVEDTVGKWVEALRVKEVAFLRRFYNQLILVGATSQATVNVAGLSALGTFVGIWVAHRSEHEYEYEYEVLKPDVLFTILTVVNLVTLPISTIGNCFPLLLASWASMRRIAAFLSLPEKEDVTRWEDGPGASDDEKKPEESSSEGSSVTTTSNTDSNADRAIILSHVSVASSHSSSAPVKEKEKDRPILNDCSARFEQGKLTMVVGPVGAGKSTLLKTLLGETSVVHGSVHGVGKGKVAYAPQHPFVVPGYSVRSNIVLSPSPSSSEWYKEVIRACELKLDLAGMSASDETVLGEGTGVSGGQRQRISLARAVYAKCDVTLLDDCFSALDAHTSKAVFKNLFDRERGLMRDKTVVLITHNVRHLSAADHVVVLDCGNIVAQGRPEELRARGGLERYVGEEAKLVEREEEVPGEEADISDQAGSGAEKTGTETTEEKGAKEKKVAATKRSDDDEEKGVRGAASWAPYIFYMKACGFTRLFACFTCLFIYTGMQVGLQVLLIEWSESQTTQHAPWLGGYAAFTSVCFLSSYITMRIYTQHTVPHASLFLHAKQLGTVLRAPVAYFQHTPMARLQNRWSSDMFAVDFTFARALQDFAFTAAFVFGIFVLILVAVPWLAISIPFIAALYWGLQRVYLATSRQLQRLTMSSKTPLYTAFTTSLSGLVTIRAYQAHSLFKDMSVYHLDRSQAPMYWRYAGIRFLRSSLNLLTAVIAIAIAALAVGFRGSTSSAYLGVALSQLAGLAQSLINLLLAYTRVENGIVSVERVYELDNLDQETEEGRNSDPGSDWPRFGTVEFVDVGMQYSVDDSPALKHLSFKVQGGTKLGICGRTGSGKSSTVFALLQGLAGDRIALLATGKIFIDGVDISTIPLGRLRSAISTVPQDPFLVSVSLRENLTLGCSELVSDQQIWDVLDLVGMKDAVQKLEGKLESRMTADGSQFSSGERQLLCLGRVLLQRRKIVVLDEASSSMDMATDQRLLAVLQHELKGVTVISVAHRLSTIKDFDQIVVMSEGEIVEVGTPQRLMADATSRFSELQKSQSG